MSSPRALSLIELTDHQERSYIHEPATLNPQPHQPEAYPCGLCTRAEDLFKVLTLLELEFLLLSQCDLN